MEVNAQGYNPAADEVILAKLRQPAGYGFLNEGTNQAVLH